MRTKYLVFKIIIFLLRSFKINVAESKFLLLHKQNQLKRLARLTLNINTCVKSIESTVFLVSSDKQVKMSTKASTNSNLRKKLEETSARFESIASKPQHVYVRLLYVNTFHITVRDVRVST